MGRAVVDPKQKCCGTCEYWSCRNSIKVVKDGIECFPLAGNCKNLAISRNKSCRAMDGEKCTVWEKNSSL